MLRLLQRGSADLSRRQEFSDALGDGHVHPPRVDRRHRGVLLLMNVFAPDNDTERIHARNDWQRGEICPNPKP